MLRAWLFHKYSPMYNEDISNTKKTNFTKYVQDLANHQTKCFHELFPGKLLLLAFSLVIKKYITFLEITSLPPDRFFPNTVDSRYHRNAHTYSAMFSMYRQVLICRAQRAHQRKEETDFYHPWGRFLSHRFSDQVKGFFCSQLISSLLSSTAHDSRLLRSKALLNVSKGTAVQPSATCLS